MAPRSEQLPEQGSVEIGDNHSSLTISLVEVTPEGVPRSGDLCLDITARAGDFAGRNRHVWVGKEVFTGFLEELATLATRRSGATQLGSMTPDEFQLEIYVADTAGHVRVEGKLARARYGPGRTGLLRDQVAFAIDFDPTRLESLVKEFRALRA